jgi:hypothetical protein
MSSPIDHPTHTGDTVFLAYWDYYEDSAPLGVANTLQAAKVHVGEHVSSDARWHEMAPNEVGNAVRGWVTSHVRRSAGPGRIAILEFAVRCLGAPGEEADGGRH